MKKEKSVLIVFPDEWLQYSPSVLNLYNSLNEKYNTKLVYVDNGRFANDGLAESCKKIRVGKFAAYFWRKTLGYKFYKVLRLLWALLFIKLFDRRYDTVIAIDSSGYAATKVFFSQAVYFSLEAEKDIYFKISNFLGIETLIIQSEERKEYLVGVAENIKVFFLQNAPVIDEKFNPGTVRVTKSILYMGNIEFGYGLEQFIESINQLPEYTLTLKGIRNDKYYNWLNERYNSEISSGKLIFDFTYVDQSKIVEYASQFYIGITGYDLELAKKSFNYFSSPAGKLFNYYAAGVPVIGIDIIGLKSVKEYKSGILLDQVTAENIRRAIEAIERNYNEFAENSFQAGKRFDFKMAFDVFEKEFIQTENEGTAGMSDLKNFKVKSYFSKGHERSVKAKRNILVSLLIKCFSILISFLLVPLALDYLSPIKYGIWITLTSVIGWFAFFDMGLGNGLRNKLAEAFARNDRDLARSYISTSYIMLTIIIGLVYGIFVLVFPFLNWSQILNTPVEMDKEISRLVFIVFSFFSLQFIIKLIGMILQADQRSGIGAGINTLASLLSLIIIYILTKTTESSLLWLSIGVSAANLIAPFIATLWFFYKDYRDFIPSFKYVKLKYAKDLMGLGLLFFIMQFAALILFSTDSFIIAQLYGPEEVTPYNLAFKYFGIVTMFFGIITTPFWSAYTDAYHKKDFKWIKRITRKLAAFWLLMVMLVVAMILCSGYFYQVWVGDKIKIPVMLSVSMGVWVLISTWTSIFGNFLSGVGKIRLSLYHSFAMIIINIPLSVFLARYLNLGSTGVIIGTCLCVLPQVFLHPIQYIKIVSNKAKGIWGK